MAFWKHHSAKLSVSQSRFKARKARDCLVLSASELALACILWDKRRCRGRPWPPKASPGSTAGYKHFWALQGSNDGLSLPCFCGSNATLRLNNFPHREPITARGREKLVVWAGPSALGRHGAHHTQGMQHTNHSSAFNFPRKVCYRWLTAFPPGFCNLPDFNKTNLNSHLTAVAAAVETSYRPPSLCFGCRHSF